MYTRCAGGAVHIPIEERSRPEEGTPVSSVKTRLYQGGIIAAAVAFILPLVSCDGSGGGGGDVTPPDPSTYISGKVTGGGWVETDSGGKANFGFNASNCDDPVNPAGQFTFHDMTAPIGAVKMKGTLLSLGQCVEEDGCGSTELAQMCPEGGYVFEVEYRSTNPKMPGEGLAAACVVDNGEGINGTGDLVGFAVSGGPFDGYFISGQVHGNIQAHLCKK
jgi:hypothetical protein